MAAVAVPVRHKERILEVIGAVLATILLLAWVWYNNQGG